MSSSNFMINVIYRDNVPRGTPIIPALGIWNNTSQTTLEYIVESAMAARIKGILWSPDSAFIHSEGVDPSPKLMSISYPDEYGEEKTINIDTLRQLLLLSKRINHYESVEGTDPVVNYYLLEFEAPVILRDSLTNKKVTITFGSGTISAGELVLGIIGWEKKEAEWGF